MKAYHVQSSDGEHQEIVFAETTGKAKMKSEASGWCEYTEVRANRVKEFDQYSGLGYVPKEAMLKNGWWFECEKCSTTCTEEDAVVIDEKVFCEKCRQS
ncbi:hypothetical protein ACT7DB_06935 [Bacillus cereus]